MRAAVITVGDEILIGQVVNTNASYLSSVLSSIGIPVEKVITVGDDSRAILNEFRSTHKKYDVTIVTGGLGPTHDDITKTCISKFFRSKLVEDSGTLRKIKQIFRRRRMPMPKVNYEQALIPDIAKVVPNKVGTAPGILIDRDKKTFCALPGVPYEMKQMCKDFLLPYLRKKYSARKKIIKHKTLHTIGISESLLYETIGDISRITGNHNNAVVKLAFLPSNYETRLRISVDAKNERDADNAIKSAERKLMKRAGRFIYSRDESSIAETVGKLLGKTSQTISAAESCTGGLLASKITDVPGSSDYFLEGVITYSNSSKNKLLGVKKTTLLKYGAVSNQTAIEMAKGIRRASGSDIGISTTGIAGPSGGTKSKPVGLVWIGYSDKNISFAKDFIFTKQRLRNKEIMSKMALEIVRRQLTINN